VNVIVTKQSGNDNVGSEYQLPSWAIVYGIVRHMEKGQSSGFFPVIKRSFI